MGEFKREERFIVIKRKDLNAVPFAALQSFLEHLQALDVLLPRREYVVVESDWPEYEAVWSMIAARVEGRLTPYQVLEQQVAALRQHKTDYMEAAEGTRRALEAEAQALREQNTQFRHMLTGVVARNFSEDIKRSTMQKSMDVYLSEGIRLLEEELETLRARVVVVPGRIPSNGPKEEWYLTGWNACLDELARLNGKAVSEGLLRRVSDLFPADMGDDGSGRAGWLPHVRETVAELRALIGEGNDA